ncbi:MAG: AsmA family protein [Bradyrhizobiaceae bacterium]|nr:AsmA family protein [Bradyrhizobiaceae bacterium]
MSGSTRLKRVIAIAFAAAVVATAALVIAPHFVSVNQARLAVLHALRTTTGVEPQVEGAARLVLLPSPAIRIEGIRLDDGDGPAFTAEAIQATVRLLPALYGNVEVATLTFERPELTIDLRSNGAVRFGIPLHPQAATDASARPEIRFVDGIVHFKSDDTELTERLSDVDAAIAWSGAGITGTGSLTWRATPATISASITDMAALRRGDRSGFRARLESDLLDLGFDGGIAYRNGVQADGALAADAKSLRAALSHLPVAPLTRGGFGPFKLKARAALTPASLALNGLSIELDGNRAEGGLTLKRDRGRTVLQATLASETADFTPYSGGFAVTEDDGREWNRETIDLAALQALDLDIRLSSGRVTVRRTELEKIAAAASLRNGSFTLSVGEALYQGGMLRGRLALSPGQEGKADVKIEANIANFNLGPGMAEISGIHGLEGKGTLAFALEGAGKHAHAITRGLSGAVTLAAADGALVGINVEQALRRLERKPLSGPPEFIGGRTPFKDLHVKIRVTDGTAKIEEASVNSPLVRVKLAGTSSVTQRDFDLQGLATLVRGGTNSKEPQPFDLPFVVLGSWARPFLLPDPLALIQRSGAAAPLLEAARKQNHSEKSPEEETTGDTGAPEPAAAAGQTR